MRRTVTILLPTILDGAAISIIRIVIGKLQVNNRTEIRRDLACAIVPSLVFQQTKSILDRDQMAILHGIALLAVSRMLAEFPCTGWLLLSAQRFELFSHLSHTTLSYLS